MPLALLSGGNLARKCLGAGAREAKRWQDFSKAAGKGGSRRGQTGEAGAGAGPWMGAGGRETRGLRVTLESEKAGVGLGSGGGGWPGESWRREGGLTHSGSPVLTSTHSQPPTYAHSLTLMTSALTCMLTYIRATPSTHMCTLMHTRSHIHMFTVTHLLMQPPAPTFTHAHKPLHRHAHSHTHVLTHTYILTQHTLSHSPTPAHVCTDAHTHSQQSHTHTLTRSYTEPSTSRLMQHTHAHLHMCSQQAHVHIDTHTTCTHIHMLTHSCTLARHCYRYVLTHALTHTLTYTLAHGQPFIDGNVRD